MMADRGGDFVALEDVHFSYAGGAAHVFDLTVPAATVAAVMGPSGSGKSTLLNLIAGFEAPVSGRIRIGDHEVTDLAPAERPVSMVFQENNLFAHLDVFSNVGLGCSPSLRLDAEDEAAIREALGRTGLAGKERRLPHALSGGERQRVALARVLVRRRPVLLLDEAFASLGPALREEMLDLVAALQAEWRMTVLMATHDPDDAERLAGTIIFVDDGRATAVGPADAFLSGDGPEAFVRYVGGRAFAGKRSIPDGKKS